MDVDEVEVQDAAEASQKVEASTDRKIEKLSRLMSDLEEDPSNIPLQKQAIKFMNELALGSEQLTALQKLSDLIMLDDTQWGRLLELCRGEKEELDLETVADLLEKYDQSEQDYLSFVALERHMNFLLSCSTSLDAEVKELMSEDTLRGMMAGIVMKASGVLDQSHVIWQMYLDWEMSQLSSEGSSKNLEGIHQLYCDRLAVPHTNLQATFDAYSTFCTTNSPNDYESRLVKATEASQSAKSTLSNEKRYGQTRQDIEESLASLPDAVSRGAVFSQYIDWETDSRARSPNHEMTSAVLERAVYNWASAASAAERSIKSFKKVKGKGKGKEKAEEDNETTRIAQEQYDAYKEAEASVWIRYASWIDIIGGDTKPVYQRAVRACPGSGILWSRLLTRMERDESLGALTDTFEKALSLGLIGAAEQPVGSVVELLIQRAGYENRVEPAEDIEGPYHPVILTVIRGFDLIGKHPTCRLDRFLLEWAESRAPQFLDEVLSLVDKTNKARSSSHQFIILRAGIESRRGNIDQARKLLQTAVQRTDLDWPETVFDALSQFEMMYGTIETITESQKLVEVELAKLTRRREKAAQEQYRAYSAMVPVEQPVVEPVTMEVETAQKEVNDTFAPAATVAPVESAASEVKRDREHTTVLLSGISKTTDQSAIESFFSDCGYLRDVTILMESDRDTAAALVEFRRVDAIPAALAKDHKRIGQNEVSVSMLWRSTIFVTNFPKEADDASIRSLFEPYGHILQTRWPSRKFADKRRFCYITMESPAAAQNALELHGSVTGGPYPMSVLISDPQAKAKRSDADNTALFVGGLTPQTTEAEIRQIFQKYGAIRYVKLVYASDKKTSKGIAFVSMATEAEATAATELHGVHLNGRFLKVEISNASHTAKKSDPTVSAAEKRARTVRLYNLPEGTQEGLLQQALETIVPVKRLEMFATSHQAIAELNSESDAGKLLLHSEPFIFNGNTIEFTEQARRAPPTTDNKASSSGGGNGSALAFAPRNARKPAKELGKGRQIQLSNKAVPNFVSASTENKGQDDFRAFLEAKNQERANKSNSSKEKKRAAEDTNGDTENHDGKRAKVD